MMNFDGNKGPSTINSRNDSQSDSRNHCIYNRLQWEDLYIKIKTREVFNRIQLNANRRIINFRVSILYLACMIVDCIYMYNQFPFNWKMQKKRKLIKIKKKIQIQRKFRIKFSIRSLNEVYLYFEFIEREGFKFTIITYYFTITITQTNHILA